MRTSHLFLVTLAAATLAQTAAAQATGEQWLENCRRQDRDNDRATFCEIRETRLSASGALRVNGEQNGGVTVRAHNGSDVVVRARVQAWAPSGDVARELARGIRVSTDGTIRATGPNTTQPRHGWAVGYEILVPARTDLDVVTLNGPISVERLAGTINVRAQNGPITLRELSGTVRARGHNGPLNVLLSGTRWTGGGLDAETVNGPINLDMPRGYAARLESGTERGPLSVPAALRPSTENGRRVRLGRHISQELNGGGPTIRVVTTNGPVDIDET